MATRRPTSEPNLAASWMEKSPEVRHIEQRTRAVAERCEPAPNFDFYRRATVTPASDEIR